MARALLTWVLSKHLAIVILIVATGCATPTSGVTISEQVFEDGYYPAGWVKDGPQLLVISWRDLGDSTPSLPYFVSLTEDQAVKSDLGSWNLSEKDKGCVRIALDGSAVLKVRRYTDQDDELYLIDDYGNRKTLLLTASSFSGCPAWSPDGQWIAVVTYDGNKDTLRVLDRSGQTLFELVSSDEVIADPAWSPDGTRIAFVSGRSISTINVDKGEQSSVVIATSTYVAVGHPTWSPNGQYIAYADGWSEGNVAVIREDGTDKQYLTKADFANLTANDYYYGNLTWSPRGEYIAASRIGATADQHIQANYEVVLIPVPNEFK